MKKQSFFSRLTGGSNDEYETYAEETTGVRSITIGGENERRHLSINDDYSADQPVHELATDIYQTEDAIVIKAFIAGVQPHSVDIALTREVLTISGSRQDEREVPEDDYYQKELYWGSFARTIMLPEEVDVDLAEASEKHGILMIRLPKINKKREMKLKIKSR